MRRQRRRRVLKGIGLTTAVGLAGCTTGGGGDDDLEQVASTMYVNNDYGQQLSQAYVGALEENHDRSVYEEVAFESAQNSYTSELSTALEDDPDVLVVIGYPESGTQIFRDYYAEYGDQDRQILVTDGLQDSALPEDVGSDMSNVAGTAPLATGPQRDAFDSQYQDEFGRPPGVFNAQAYDASAVMLLANAKAGENSGTAIRDNMRAVANPGGTTVGPSNIVEGMEMALEGQEIQYAGASSSVDFDDAGDMVAVSYSYWQFDTSTEQNYSQIETIDFGGDGAQEAEPGGSGGTDREPISLAVLMPLTGDLGSLGQPIRDGAILPVRELSDAGLGVDIDLQVEDTQTDPQAAIEAANALNSAGYPMVSGPASSGVNLQVTREVFIPNQMVGCSPSSTSPNVTNLEDNDLIFRTAPSDALQSQVLARVTNDVVSG
jgi:ABC-type branched-subunit amino acid transport system substrate-binding protein